MNHNKFFHLTISIILLSLIGCSKSVSDTQVTVDGIEFKVSTVELTDTYESGSQKLKPTSATDTFLIVTLEVLSSESPKIEWNASITDENGDESFPNITSQMFSSEEYLQEIAWVYVVDMAFESLTLNFPDDQTIMLDSFLD